MAVAVAVAVEVEVEVVVMVAVMEEETMTAAMTTLEGELEGEEAEDSSASLPERSLVTEQTPFDSFKSSNFTPSSIKTRLSCASQQHAFVTP